MNLLDLIQKIPDFIVNTLTKLKTQQKTLEELSVIGQFHLGLKYDVNIWTSNRTCGVFTCHEEK